MRFFNFFNFLDKPIGFPKLLDSQGPQITSYRAPVLVSSAVLLMFSDAASAVTRGITWTNPTTGTMMLLDGSTVVVFPSGGGVIPNSSIVNVDLSDTNKFCPPLGSSQQIDNYDLIASSTWTANFLPSPVPDLLLYIFAFRGVGSGNPGTTTYTFTDGSSAPLNPTLQSGTGGTVAGNVLSVPTTGYFNGILRFSGPISTLNVTTDATLTGNQQGFTFGVSDALAQSCQDTPPTATNVNLTLSPTGAPTWVTGESLMGNYTYGDVDLLAPGNTEAGTIFQWYQATDASCSTGRTPIASATTQTYTLASGDIGKYICFGVTPKNTNATGTEVVVTSSSAITAPPTPPTPPPTSTPSTSPLPSELGLFLQIDGAGAGKVTSNTGLSCQTSDCQKQSDGSLLCDSQVCSQAVKTATTVTLTPQADIGSYFSSWGGHTSCTAGQFLMNSGRLCIAYFRLLDEPLTVITQGQGTVTAPSLTCPGTCVVNYPYGTSITLQTQPAMGWQFQAFSGDCNSNGQLLMTDTRNCGVTFIPDPVTYDEDFDHISSSVEDQAPNHGDGNGDGIPDSQQTQVSSFPDASSGLYLTLQVDQGCPITNVYGELSDKYPGLNRNYHFPQGLTYFELNCAKTQVTLYSHAFTKLLRNLIFYKFGPTVPGDLNTAKWYKYPATFALTTIGGQPVVATTYTLTDGQLGDSTGVDGKIVDPAGLSDSQLTLVGSDAM